MTTRAVLITGVSTGIGHTAATHLLQQGYHVFGSVRSEKHAVDLCAHPAFTRLVFDVVDHEAIRASYDLVATTLGDDGRLVGLVNNAGIAVSGPLAYLPMDDFRRQFEINVFGVLAVTQTFLPLLKQARGRIINVSSVSGRWALPFVGAYAASKHALEAFTDSLRREQYLNGVDVVSLQPGAIYTPIWDKVPDLGSDEYFGNTEYAPLIGKFAESIIDNRRRGLPAERVARAIQYLLEARRPPTRYLLTGNPLLQRVYELLPRRVIDYFIARRLGMRWPG